MVKKQIALHTLSEDECQSLVAIAAERHGLALSEAGFADVILGLFEDIPGFETMPIDTSAQLLQQLWSFYMAKKSATVTTPETAATASDATAPATKSSNPIEVDLSRPVIRSAIEQGQAALAEGKTKADAARAIYDEIKDEPKEVIVAAFVAGAALTEKGALTYWYNCRRKAAKETTAAKTD